MNTALSLCLAFLGLLFSAFAFVFAVRKEKACSLIGGFNFFTEAQQKQYDRARIARDYQKLFIILALVMFAGAAAGLFLGWWAFGASIGAMLVLLFRDFHLFAEDAFKKYKL
ncbi:MAG: DUF3784 domain-containing protein [Clostridia bacterium]|nr:DUF3784 domain-containing protein [Clostridia bacterium]